MKQKEIIEDVIQALQTWEGMHAAVVGFDGYIDRIKKAVKKRNESGATYFPNISSFADRISFAAGKSAQIEVIQEEIKLGGNGPIMANALHYLNFDTTCIGMLGSPDLHPAFQNMPGYKISLGVPAETTALEFSDGKIMLSDLTSFESLHWDQLERIVGINRLIKLFSKSALLALVDWSNLPHAIDLLQGIAQHIIPALGHKPHIFFDLADPTRKSAEEIVEMLRTMGLYSTAGTVTLGVNKNEALYLYETLYQKSGEKKSLPDLGIQIFQRTSIDQLLIHPIDSGILIQKEKHWEMPGRLVQNPIIQTGAGDNLNAGFCLAQLMNLSPNSALILSMAASGAYIANGQSPSITSIIEYLNLWKSELI